MKRIVFLLTELILISLLTISCKDNREFNSISSDIQMNNNIIQKSPDPAEVTIDLLPIETFQKMGTLHNEFLDYLKIQLKTLPLAYSTITEKETLILEVSLLEDFIVQHMHTFLSKKVNAYDKELDVFAKQLPTILSNQKPCVFLENPSYSKNHSTIWTTFREVYYSDYVFENKAIEILHKLFNDVYKQCEEKKYINLEEYTLLSMLAIGQASISYWSDKNVIDYTSLFGLYETIYKEPNFNPTFFRWGWWHSDVTGAGIVGIAAIFTPILWWVPIFVGGVSSAIHAINEYVFTEADFSDPSKETVIIFDNTVYYSDPNINKLFNLYDIMNPNNPYITGEFKKLTLPKGYTY